MVSDDRLRQVGVPTAVRETQLDQLRRHLSRATETSAPLWSPAVQRWWADIADEFSISDTETSGSLVLVDALRGDTPAVDSVGAESGPNRLVFCELGSAEGRRLDGALEAIDVTGLLWARGLTVIDVDRVPVRTARGTWQVVAGIARRTPQVS